MRTATLHRAIAACTFLLTLEGAQGQCNFIRADDFTNDTATFTYFGGSFASFGCAPIDPTYWISGAGMWITATFAAPKDLPKIRVWGMNDDDTASVAVNGTPYPLNALTAHYEPKVICGSSPGPDGVIFANGKLTGSSSANYSYQDVVLDVDDVTSITVTGLAGAGWGFVGVVVDCASPTQAIVEHGVEATTGVLYMPHQLAGAVSVRVLGAQGMVVKRPRPTDGSLDLSDLPPGVYTIVIDRPQQRTSKRIMKL